MIRSRSALFSSPSYSDDTVGGSQQEEWEIMHSTLPGQQTHLVDLQQLQEDVVISHIVGKPLIEPPSSFRYPFHFRNSIPHSKKRLLNFFCIPCFTLCHTVCLLSKLTLKLYRRSYMMNSR